MFYRSDRSFSIKKTTDLSWSMIKSMILFGGAAMTECDAVSFYA